MLDFEHTNAREDRALVRLSNWQPEFRHPVEDIEPPPPSEYELAVEKLTTLLCWIIDQDREGMGVRRVVFSRKSATLRLAVVAYALGVTESLGNATLKEIASLLDVTEAGLVYYVRKFEKETGFKSIRSYDKTRRQKIARGQVRRYSGNQSESAPRV